MMKRDWRDFKSSYGNIEGARDGFEDACQILFSKVYPDKYVAKMAVKQGDEGIDICIGELGVEPIIVIQCKFFLETFSDAQKSQIRDSFERAINSEKYELKEWILCIPREIDIDETSWWAKWKKKKIDTHSRNMDFIKLKNGIDLISLMKKHNVYNEIFQIEHSLKIDEIHKKICNNETSSDKNNNINIEKKESHIICKDGYIEPTTVYIEELGIHVAVCPVTFEEYDLFCADKAIVRIPNDYNWGRGKQPVIDVSWYDAIEYCNWLNKKNGKDYRLLSLDEWEYIVNKNFSQKNYKENIVCSQPYTSEVASKRQGLLGLYDILGNTYEWCGNDKYTSEKKLYGITFKDRIEELDILIKNEIVIPNHTCNYVIGFRIAYSET